MDQTLGHGHVLTHDAMSQAVHKVRKLGVIAAEIPLNVPDYVRKKHALLKSGNDEFVPLTICPTRIAHLFIPFIPMFIYGFAKRRASFKGKANEKG